MSIDIDSGVVEAGEGIGVGVSSRNCEVIHAGIYDPDGFTAGCWRYRPMPYR